MKVADAGRARPGLRADLRAVGGGTGRGREGGEAAVGGAAPGAGAAGSEGDARDELATCSSDAPLPYRSRSSR
jgi:hypothetical protein